MLWNIDEHRKQAGFLFLSCILHLVSHPSLSFYLFICLSSSGQIGLSHRLSLSLSPLMQTLFIKRLGIQSKGAQWKFFKQTNIQIKLLDYYTIWPKVRGHAKKRRKNNKLHTSFTPHSRICAIKSFHYQTVKILYLTGWFEQSKVVCMKLGAHDCLNFYCRMKN